MRICVVGSGGREHALAHTLSPHADVVVTPGSPGIEREYRSNRDRDRGESLCDRPGGPIG